MKLSLIIPYYNRAQTLNRLFDSILAQTRLPDEIILVNNNSTDNSYQLASTFQQCMLSFPMCVVKLLNCSEKGAAAARNIGLSNTSCEYVYFFDSDDVLSPDFFEKVYAELAVSDVDILVFKTRILKSDGTSIIRSYGFSTAPYYQIFSSFLTTQTMVLKRSFLQTAGGWNARLFYWNDWELGVRLLMHRPSMRYVSSPAFHTIYAHANSITGSSFASKFNEILFALQTVYDYPQLSSFPSCVKSLYWRKAIMAGNIYREGAKECAQSMLQYTFQTQNANKKRSISFMEKLLYLYTSIGGKSAWKLATLFVKLQK